MRTSNPPGRVTPGGLLLVGALVAVGWFVLQPADDRASLACQPLQRLSRWLTADTRAGSVWDQKVTQLMGFLDRQCPDSVGAPAASLAERALGYASSALITIKAVTNRQITAVQDSTTLKVAGLGPVRLLGITVPPEHREAALQVLQATWAGQRLPVEVYSDRDPDYLPLVTVYLDTAKTTSVNAQLLQRGLALPWNLPGPWQTWAGVRPPAGTL